MAKLTFKEQLAAKLKAKENGDTAVVSEPVVSVAPVQVSKGLAESSAIPDVKTKISAAGRDRSALIVDVRELKDGIQIRTILKENPEAYSKESIESLASLIEFQNEGKIRQSIDVVRNDKDELEIIEGKRRTLACIHLAEKTHDESFYFQPVRVNVVNEGADIELLQFSLNNSKEEVDRETTVFLFVKKIKEGLEQKELCEMTGFSKTKVSRLVKVSTYPEEIQDMIFSGDLPLSGPSLEKALKEMKAINKAIEDRPNDSEIAQSKDLSHTEPSDVVSVDFKSTGVGYLIDEETAADSPTIDSSPDEMAVKKESKKPAKKPAKPTKKEAAVSIDESIAKKLFSLVLISEFLLGIEEDSKAIDKVPSRKDMIEKFKSLDKILNKAYEEHLNKSVG